MFNLLPLFLTTVIWCGAFLIAFSPILLFYSSKIYLNYLYLALTPILFLFFFISIAAGLSRWAHRGIICGTFPREPFHEVYFLRRIYGACWTQVYYFKPLYAVALSIPFLKKYLFRSFGYKHNCNFTVYPDTWIRDLPVLNIGDGAYLSNRATIGTNICLADGKILVDSVEVREKGLVGHLAVLAPGAMIGKNVEVGVSAVIAIRTKLNENSKVNPCCMINHGTVVGEFTRIGTMSYIGVKSVLGTNLNIPAGANIPAGSILNTQEEVDKVFNTETQQIEKHVSILKDKFHWTIDNELKT